MILLASDDFGLFLGFVGLAAAYLAMFMAVVLSEMTIDDLKKKLNKIIKMLEKKKP